MSDDDATIDDDVICFICRRKGEASKVEIDNYSTCESCNWAFHPRCYTKRIASGKSNKCCTYVAQSTFTLKDTWTKWSAEISKIKNSMGDLGDRVVSDELDSINKEVKELSGRMDHIMADAIDEISLRKKKASNVMLYNMIDRNKESLDKGNIIKILDKVGVSDHDFTFQRIGEFKENSSRPIVVFFKNQESARRVMAERNSIMKISVGPNTTKKVGISSDKTRYQRQLLKNAITLLEKRRRSGEENLQIKYINGNPTLMKKKSKKAVRIDPNDTILE